MQCWLVAQWVERRSDKAEVGGSSPSGPSAKDPENHGEHGGHGGIGLFRLRSSIAEHPVLTRKVLGASPSGVSVAGSERAEGNCSDG